MKLQLTRLEKRFDLPTYLEQFDHKMVGDNAVLTCPQCERDEKLYVLMKEKRDQNGELVPRGTWICYYCNDNDSDGAGRTCLSLIEWLEDVEFVEGARRLAEGGSSMDADFIGTLEKVMSTLDEEDGEEDTAPPPTIALPNEFIRIDEERYPPYVAERGISALRAMRFGLGFCMRGNYANRLLAPVYFDRRCVGFQARYMQKKPPIDEATGERIKKTKHAFGAKMSRVLYNWDEARYAKRLVLVESPWAVIKIGRTGAGTFGKSLSAAQRELILRSDAEEIVLMWDRDADHAPGKGGYDKAVVVAESFAQLIPTRAVRMPDKRDPDEHTVKRLRRLIAETPILSANDVWAERLKRRVSWLE